MIFDSLNHVISGLGYPETWHSNNTLPSLILNDGANFFLKTGEIKTCVNCTAKK